VTRVLRDRAAGLYLAGVVVSGFGTSALWLVSGVWVKELTGSDGLAALCLVAMWLPTLAGPLLGTLADRTRRKPLLIGANLLLAALLPTLFAVDSPGRLWLLYMILFVYGATGVVHDAAESALVTAAVAPSLLGDFNGLRMTANEGMKLVAPLAGAGLFAVYGGPAVALLDALTFVLATGVYALVPVREEKPRRPTTDWRARTAEGTRHLWAHPRLRPLVLAAGATMFCAGLSGSLLYAVIDSLGRPPSYAGVLYAVQGAGSVAVGLAGGPLMRRLGERHRPHGARGGGAGRPCRSGGPRVRRDERGGSALRPDRRADPRTARDTGRPAGPHDRDRRHPDVHAERARAGAGRGRGRSDRPPAGVGDPGRDAADDGRLSGPHPTNAEGARLGSPPDVGDHLTQDPPSTDRTASRSASDPNPA